MDEATELMNSLVGHLRELATMGAPDWTEFGLLVELQGDGMAMLSGLYTPRGVDTGNWIQPAREVLPQHIKALSAAFASASKTGEGFQNAFFASRNATGEVESFFVYSDADDAAQWHLAPPNDPNALMNAAWQRVEIKPSA